MKTSIRKRTLRSKAFSLLTALTSAAAIVPGSAPLKASATEPDLFDIWVKGLQVASENMNDVPGNGGVS